MKKCTTFVNHEPVLGLDIAQASFVAELRFDPTRHSQKQFANHRGGFRQLKTWLHQHFTGKARVGLEATGIYSEAIAHWLHAEGHVVHVLNPARVAAYARSIGQRNKTDPADARMIAQYVFHHSLPIWTPPPPEHAKLKRFTRLRRQLGDERQVLKNQRHSAGPEGAAILDRLIANFERELKVVEKALHTLLAEHPHLGEQVRRLTTIKGIGDKTATVVLAELPPITPDSDPRALCAWCGLTPRRHQSGNFEGRAYLGRAGNVHLRKALFMPSLVAKNRNPVLQVFAQRLAQTGHRPTAILGAVSHKLLRLMIGLLKHQQDFDPNWHPKKT
jgi:transposase